MKKRITAIIVVLAMALTLLPAAAFAANVVIEISTSTQLPVSTPVTSVWSYTAPSVTTPGTLTLQSGSFELTGGTLSPTVRLVIASEATLVSGEIGGDIENSGTITDAVVFGEITGSGASDLVRVSVEVIGSDGNTVNATAVHRQRNLAGDAGPAGNYLKKGEQYTVSGYVTLPTGIYMLAPDAAYPTAPYAVSSEFTALAAGAAGYDFYAPTTPMRIVVSFASATPVVTFSAHPANKELTFGSITASDTLTAQASVTGGGAVSYKWFECSSAGVPNGAALGTSRVFPIPTNLSATEHYFVCQASSPGAAPAYSNVATVNVSFGTVVSASVYVGNTAVDSYSTATPLYNGTVQYQSGVLTLNGITVTGASHDGAAIYSSRNLILVLNGVNTVTGPAGANKSFGVSVTGSLTVRGEGSLTASGGAVSGVDCQSIGVSASNGITLESGTLNANGGTAQGDSVATGDADSYGVRCSATGITVSGGTLNAVAGTANDNDLGRSMAVWSKGDITVTRGSLTGRGAAGTHSFGVVSSDGHDIVVSGGSLTGFAGAADETSGQSSGVESSGAIRVSGTGALSGTSGNGAMSVGVAASEDITVSGGSLVGNGGSGSSVAYSIGVMITNDAGDGVSASGGSLKGTGAAASIISCGVYSVSGVGVSGGSLTGDTTAGSVTPQMCIGVYGIAGTNVSGGSLTATGRAANTASYGLALEEVAGGKLAFTGGVITLSGETSAANAQPLFTDAAQTNENWYMWKAGAQTTVPAGEYTNSIATQYSFQNTHKYLVFKPSSPNYTLLAMAPLSEGDRETEFISNGAYGSLLGVELNGDLLDDSLYTVSDDGGALITLDDALLDGLADGTHTLRAVFPDGYGQTLIVVGVDIPATGDGAMPWIWLALILAAGLAAVALIANKRRA